MSENILTDLLRQMRDENQACCQCSWVERVARHTEDRIAHEPGRLDAEKLERILVNLLEGLKDSPHGPDPADLAATQLAAVRRQ